MLIVEKTTPKSWPTFPGAAGLTLKILADGRIWVGDHIGAYLCHADTFEEIKPLLDAERRPYPDHVHRGHLRLGAREIIEPGSGEAREASTIARHEEQRRAYNASVAKSIGLEHLTTEGLLDVLGL